MKKIITVVALFAMVFATPTLAQWGGTKALTDTQTVAQKFHVLQLRDGQRMTTPRVDVDTLNATIQLVIPLTNPKPTCDAGAKGLMVTDTASNLLYFCNGSSWNAVAYDVDRDGLTTALDANDAVDFTAGNASAGSVRTGYTFYTGAGMTYTTGTIGYQGTVHYTPSTSNQSIASGIHSGSGVAYGDGDISAGNIAQNITLWGVGGSKLHARGCGVGASAHTYSAGENYTDYCDNDHDGSVDEVDGSSRN